MQNCTPASRLLRSRPADATLRPCGAPHPCEVLPCLGALRRDRTEPRRQAEEFAGMRGVGERPGRRIVKSRMQEVTCRTGRSSAPSGLLVTECDGQGQGPWYGPRFPAAHGLCSQFPSVSAWIRSGPDQFSADCVTIAHVCPGGSPSQDEAPKEYDCSV